MQRSSELNGPKQDPPRGLEAAEGSTRPEGSGALRQEDPKDFPKYFDGRAEVLDVTLFVGLGPLTFNWVQLDG